MVLLRIPPQLIAKLMLAATSAIPIFVGAFALYMKFADFFLYGVPLAGKAKVGLSYDFIVVGAGSAGSAVAARLSEDTSVSVLLLESGGNPNPFTYIPMAVPYLSHELTEYPYATVPQAHSAFGVKGQSIPWPRGRGLGGTSNTNFMMYNRGNPRDYDRWAHITKDKRWSWKNVLRFYLKMEDYYGYWDGNGFHSKGGPLRIEPVRYAPGSKFVLAAGEEIGLPTRDANRNVQTPGISPIDFTQERGYRFSTYRAYIQPNEKRPNLNILRYSQVVKINFDDELRAKGVTFLRHGVQQYVEAKKEIIISAGTMGSPQLLMLSGIGPKEHLLELGIKPLLDLPVGNNLQDHVVTYVGPFLLKKKHTSFIQERDLGLGAMLNYMKDGSGPLSTPMGAMQFGLVSTSFTHPSWSDIFWSMQNVGVHGALGDSLDVLFNTKGHIFKRYLSPHLGQEAHFVIQSLGLPKSVGYLRLPDKNPNSLPIIDPKYYSDPKGQDMNAMLEGIQVLLKLYENTTSLGRELGAHLSPRHIPGCEEHLHRSRSYWECVVRTLTGTLYHPTGTCTMGKRGDPRTVVDSQLRVVGTKGLRVADSSIMPRVVNTNTNAPAIMIGEQCADMIKHTWGLLRDIGP